MGNLMREPDAFEPERDHALYEDCLIVPAQFYPHRRGAVETQPLKRLMTAMLVDAVQCFQSREGQTIKTKEISEARTWIFGQYADFPFSFKNACTELGVSPDRIRRQLIRLEVKSRRSGDRKTLANLRRGVSPPFSKTI
jgi:hypothetical protein